MLMVFILGAAPSSFTDPVTSPAVAGSIVLPAGALAAGAAVPDESSFFPPQPVTSRAKAPIAREYIPNLLFITKNFLLSKKYENRRLRGLKPPRKMHLKVVPKGTTHKHCDFIRYL